MAISIGDYDCAFVRTSQEPLTLHREENPLWLLALKALMPRTLLLVALAAGLQFANNRCLLNAIIGGFICHACTSI